MKARKPYDTQEHKLQGSHAMAKFVVLSDEDVEAIHEATLRILSEVGILLTEPEGVEILTGSGAAARDDRLYLPPDLVEREIAKCPPKVTIYGRDKKAVVLGDGTLHWHNLGGARDVYEPRSRQKGPAMVQDVCESAKVLDALENVTTVTPFFTPQDVPGPLMTLAMYRHTLPHTIKPVHGPGVQTAAEVRYIVRMARVIGRPPEVLTLGISPISPLTFPNDVVKAMIETARSGVPLGPLPCPTAGATSPMSLAGSLAQQNAEVLASIVLAQLVHPGLPIFYCGRLAMMEPRTGFSVWGGVELGLASAATVQIGHLYHLPVNVYGFSTNAHTLNIQNGYERALNAVIPALAGADELSGIGEMEAGVMGSYAQMVCDDEIAAGIRRLQQGFRVNEDALAVEVIKAVMEGPSNFLEQQHTVDYLRGGEICITHLADRRSWGEWDATGREEMMERAQAKATRLIAEHEVPPLTEDQELEIEAIMQEAEHELITD
jgi:trimethylamine--corrinoid protein Co-methyltransferase